MGCDHDCSSCAENCSSRTQPQDLREKLNDLSSVKKVIGVISGKGGVGKSLVTSTLAVTMNRRGHKTAILDADITGPSIPKAFNLHDRAKGNDFGIYPETSKTGIDIMSINLLLENETDPVTGTGDVALTVFQSIPVDGIIIVTSPQDLVSMIVEKAVKMAQMMNVPILGIVENMSYFMCPNCGEKHHIYGESMSPDIPNGAVCYVRRVTGKVIDYGKCVDRGMVELYSGDFMENAADELEKL